MQFTVEKKSFTLKTSKSNVINTNKSIITWNCINLRVLLDDLYNKHKKFNIVLKMIARNTVALTSTSTNRQTKICLKGLNFLYNYDIEYKCNFNKAILIGQYYYNTSDNLLQNPNFEDLQITANGIQTISTMTNAQLETFKWYGSTNTTLLNGNSVFGFTRPYPNASNQIISFQQGVGGTYIYNEVYLTKGIYSISFYIANRPNYTTTVPLSIYVDNTIIYNVTAPVGNAWTQYTTTFTTDNDKTYNIQFYTIGVNATDVNFAIDSIILNKLDITNYFEHSSIQTFTTDSTENVDLTIELVDFNSNTTSTGVFPDQIFHFDIYPIVD
jgi:hypothetical protein